MNGWLDPTVVGEFRDAPRTEIRTSLSLDETPMGVPGATRPLPRDYELIVEEYPITAGDTLDIEINELRQRQVSYRTQIPVSPAGYVNLPVVGRVDADGLTPPEFQEALKRALQERTVLVDPEVTVNPLFLGKATYSIFGIGVSAANNAPLRAGIFPIRRPDLRLLDAINQVGGLNEFVTEVYIFRQDPQTDVDNSAANSRDDANVAESNDRSGALNGPFSDSPGQSADRNESGSTEHSISPEQELFDLIEGRKPEVQIDDPDVAQRPGVAGLEGAVPPDVPPELEPDLIDPYIFVDGEFVPNPAYQRRGPGEGVPASPAAAQTITPGVSWDRIAGDTMFRIVYVSAEQLRSGDVSANLYVRPGDVIRIVSGEIGIYYVMGQVNRVGPFNFNAEHVTLKAAIAAAGGLSGLAWPSRCTIYRRMGLQEQMIQVDLDRIFAGLDPDFLIRRGDIVNVGTHPFAPFLQRIRAFTLPNPVANVGYGFTYARNFADIDSYAVKQNPANQPSRFPALFP